MGRKNLPLVNREISWLSFNGRVLQEAEDKNVPLIERLKFLGIFSNNLDEFFRIRVATLRRLLVVEKGAKKVMGDNPRKILEKIQRLVVSYQEKFDSIYSDVKLQLRAEGIYIMDETELDPDQVDFVRSLFKRKISMSLGPIMISRLDRFPQLVDQSIYLAVKLSSSENRQAKEYSLIEIPTRNISRFIRLPRKDNQEYIILLDDVIRLCLDMVYSILPYDRFEAYTIKITRDAELDVDNDISESLLDKISKGVKNRKRGEPVRLVYDEKIAPDLLNFIVKGLSLDEKDYILPGGRYHNFKDFMDFPNFGRSDLVNAPMKPVQVAELENASSILGVMAKHDFILHYPFHDFAYYVKMLREAAIDPKVTAIYITLYRMAAESRVVNALMNAAQNGKKVTAVIELRARFDEHANIYWAKQMQEAGVNVVFGMPGIKVHSKMTLIIRHEGRKDVRYAVVSTGNFHEGNANLYTDVNLFTVNQGIAREVEKVFTFLEFNYKTFSYKHLLVSPVNMRRKLYSLIENEMDNAAKKLPAYIHCKINNLVDTEMIAKLYQASQAGVEIKLVVRGICSLVPGVKGVSDNIEVFSIVDRLLEHSRIFIFANSGKETCYISSADWMTRNLDYRVEIATPIYDKHLISELKTVINMALKDNVKSRVIDQKQSNSFRNPEAGEEPFRSQLELYRYYKSKENLQSTATEDYNLT